MNGPDNFELLLVTHTVANAATTDNTTSVDRVVRIDCTARDLGTRGCLIPQTNSVRRARSGRSGTATQGARRHGANPRGAAELPAPALHELAKDTRSGEPVDSVLHEIFPVASVTMPAAPTTPATRTTPPAPDTLTARPTPLAPNATAFEVKLEMLPGNLPAWLAVASTVAIAVPGQPLNL